MSRSIFMLALVTALVTALVALSSCSENGTTSGAGVTPVLTPTIYAYVPPSEWNDWQSRLMELTYREADGALVIDRGNPYVSSVKVTSPSETRSDGGYPETIYDEVRTNAYIEENGNRKPDPSFALVGYWTEFGQCWSVGEGDHVIVMNVIKDGKIIATREERIRTTNAAG